MTAPEVDFDPKAARYDDLRPVDDAWWESFGAIVRAGDLRGHRVIEVGCGTGRFAKALEEREIARVARGESLPFKRGWFDRGAMRMVAHLVDRPRVFAELARVLSAEGRLIVATEDPATFDDVWLTRFFPSVPEIERARFPGEAALRGELTTGGFERVAVERLEVVRALTRKHTLATIREKAYSTFDLLPAEEYDAGLARAEADLPQTFEHRFRWLFAVADRA